jgi:ATP-dependent Lon protease
LFFDEFDKASDKKDIMSTLLHITDFSQNNEFRDNYFPELTQDLSRMWFIYSMNELPTDPAMLDRLEVINVDEYTTEERILISNNYLIPKYTNELKIGDVITFTESGIKKVVEISSGKNHKKGVRDLERCINLVVEKVYFYLCNREVSYEYKWFKKIHSCDDQGKIKIGGEVVESILDDVKKESNNNMMYL